LKVLAAAAAATEIFLAPVLVAAAPVRVISKV
jgi:hypothetical protein